ncbi:DUF2267 domain-containing protein [Pseudonocardia sp. C8]|uniref:DUF2267 domain-containing protein n=1 Tax=Pseudonocardia sp. C8 TaxID=2762759 RepID=UPI0016428FC7|nr:DUF2267 domain-containing protein [Pseudonocardia sp. C8]MBC3191064.1 DUF2267 domain-containing protein [Pseudonocardia sp. C8]
MKAHEFLAGVQRRGNYANPAEAEVATRAVLRVLSTRLTGNEARDLASQVPQPLDEELRGRDDRTADGDFGVSEFVQRVADQIGTDETAARTHTEAVLATIAETVTGGQLNHILTQLPSGYAALFGRAELS